MKHYIPVCVMFCALLAFASCAKDNTQPTSNNTTTQSANNGGNSSGNNGGGTQTASIVGTQWQANNNGDVYILHFIDGNTVMMRMGSNAVIGTYTYNNGSGVITFSLEGETTININITYTISGNTLYATENGSTVVFTKM